MYNFLVVVNFFVTCATCKAFLFLVSIIAGNFSSLKLLLAGNYDKCSNSVFFFKFKSTWFFNIGNQLFSCYFSYFYILLASCRIF
jgi:hypothetical protein